MEKKEPSKLKYLFDFFVLLLILYFFTVLSISLDMSKGTETIKSYTNYKGETISNTQYDYAEIYNNFIEFTKETPFSLYFTKQSFLFLLIGLFLFFIFEMILVFYRKNYISDVEHGSSRWGKKADIKHLTRKFILRKQIMKTIFEFSSFKDKKKKINMLLQKYGTHTNLILSKTEIFCKLNNEGLNNNCVVTGGSGTRKTTGIIVPNILEYNENPESPSFVATDPKGDILLNTGKYISSINYDVLCLNLKELNESCHYNPMFYINEYKFEEEISTLSDFTYNSNKKVNESNSVDNPFWDDMALVLWKSLLFAVYEGFPLEERTIPTAIILFRWFEVFDNDDRETRPCKLDKFFNVFGDINGTLEVSKSIYSLYVYYLSNYHKQLKLNLNYFDSVSAIGKNIAIPVLIKSGEKKSDFLIYNYIKELNYIYKSVIQFEDDENIKSLYKITMKKINEYIKVREVNYEGFEKPIGVKMFEKYGDVNTNPALRNWEDFRTKCKGKTAQSVTATLLSKISIFDEKETRRIFSKDDLQLDKIGEKHIGIYITLSPTNPHYTFISNMFFTQLLQQIEYCATVKYDQKMPIPVQLFIDEAYNVGKIPNFPNYISYARSFGLSIMIMLQSLEQLKEMYDKASAIILDNCTYFLYLGGIKFIDTLKNISEMIGSGTFDKRTFGRSKGSQSSSSDHYDKLGRDLLNPSEVQRLSKKKSILFVTGYHPFLSDKFNLYKHKNFKKTGYYKKSNLFKYNNINFTHGEQNGIADDSEEVLIKSDYIQSNDDIENAYSFINNNLMSVDFENIPEDLSDDELEKELLLIKSILDENETMLLKDEENVKNNIHFLKSNLIHIKNDDESITTTLNEFDSNIENVDVVFDDFGVSMDEEEIFGEGSESDKSVIEKELENLKINLLNEDFLNVINDMK